MTTLRAVALAPLIVAVTVLAGFACLTVTSSPPALAIDGGAAADDLKYVGRLTAVHRTTLGEYGGRCGAVLVAPDWAVTAGHCTRHDAGDYAPQDITISFASNRADGSGGRTARVSEIVRGSADIALLRLSVDLPLKPVALASDVPADAVRVAAFGWGRGTGAAGLESADMRVVSSDATTLVSVPDGPNAGLANHGDSGGPLLVALPTGGRALVGIAESVMVGNSGERANMWVRTDRGSSTESWIAEHVRRA